MKRVWLAYTLWLAAVLSTAVTLFLWYRYVENMRWNELRIRLREVPPPSGSDTPPAPESVNGGVSEREISSFDGPTTGPSV